MNKRLALGVVAVAALALGVALGLLSQQPPAAAVTYRLRMQSDPYPMTLGRATLKFLVEASDGSSVDTAAVTMRAEMSHRGMMPLSGQASGAVDGAYRMVVTWSMPGHWIVDARAVLPDGATLAEEFIVYVYAVEPFAGINQSTYYRSSSELAEVETTNPDREYWIIIPQGAQEMVRTGQEDGMVPAVIKLQAAGRNTLVIRNDDIADHSIGPYFVRAGETVRQVFTAPMTVIGLCTIRGSSEVSIIVE